MCSPSFLSRFSPMLNSFSNWYLNETLVEIPVCMYVFSMASSMMIFVCMCNVHKWIFKTIKCSCFDEKTFLVMCCCRVQDSQSSFRMCCWESFFFFASALARFVYYIVLLLFRYFCTKSRTSTMSTPMVTTSSRFSAFSTFSYRIVTHEHNEHRNRDSSSTQHSTAYPVFVGQFYFSLLLWFVGGLSRDCVATMRFCRDHE